MTRQVGDVVYIDGERRFINGAIPLPCAYSGRKGYQVSHERILERPEREFQERYSYSLVLNPEEHHRGADAVYNSPQRDGVTERIKSTACLRQYIAVWELVQGALHLKSIEGRLRLHGEPLFADWFTGEFEILEGEVLQKGLFLPVLSEKHQIFEFQDGMLKSERIRRKAS